MPISCYCVTSDSTSQVLLSGHNANGIVCQQDTGDTDLGVDIMATWEPKAVDLGSPERTKKVKRVFVEEGQSVETSADISIAPNYATEPTDLTFVGSESHVLMYRVPSTVRKSRYVVLKITHSKGAYELRGIMFPYKATRKAKVRRSSATPTLPETPPEELPGGEA